MIQRGRGFESHPVLGFFSSQYFFKSRYDVTGIFLGHEAEVEGTLSVQPQAHPVKGFEEYFLNLTVKTNTRNPWFVGETCFPFFSHTSGTARLVRTKGAQNEKSPK